LTQAAAQGAPSTADSLDELIRRFHDQPRPRSTHTGQILVDMGIITPEQLETALALKHEAPKRRIGEILLAEGYVTPHQLAQALARRFQVPFVGLENFEVEPQALALLPEPVALKLGVLPLALSGERLVVAFPDPTDLDAINTVSFLSGHAVEPVVAPVSAISQLQEYHYSQAQTREVIADTDSRLQDLIEQSGDGLESLGRGQPTSPNLEQLERQANELPIVRLVKNIILNAIIREASDIQLRPEEEAIRVFYRIDGRLYEQETIRKHLLRRVVSRIKILGQMDIAERRLPQDGHATMMRQGRPVDLRISIIPTVNGESVVIRILDKDMGLKPLADLGLPETERKRLEEIIARRQGMLLVTGPTGSGKSTTLYSLLNELRRGEPHIVTVEDPVEYAMEGVEQIQVAPKAGFTFAQALRHILRHDPDVIMVGEIRDRETAEVAMKAALTGHLVLSTLHTNDAASAVARLRDMGIPPYLISATLLGVMAQRLVRRNCPECLAPAAEMDGGIRQRLGLADGETFYRSGGCPSCGDRGYRGRQLVPEVLTMDNNLRDGINADLPYQDLRRLARDGGMATLSDNALDLARDGTTSLEEAFAVRLD
jgi:type IV pilus assembly protein PilB